MNFYAFIPKLLNMSLTASVAIVFVLLLRLMLKKAPKVISDRKSTRLNSSHA